MSATMIAVVDVIAATKTELFSDGATAATGSVDQRSVPSAMSEQALTAPRWHCHDEHSAAFDKYIIYPLRVIMARG